MESDLLMPQPLSKKFPQGHRVVIFGDQALDDRPKLAMMAMAVVAAWSHVEYALMGVFAHLAGGAQTDAGALYFSLEQKGAKASAIKLLADRKLDAANRELLRAIMGIAKERQAKRDKLAHWIWGTCHNLDALLLVNPLERFRAGDSTPSYDDMFVYDENEFKRLRKEMEQVSDWALHFRFILMNHPSNRNNELFDQLCKEPEIARRLARREQAG